MATNESLRIRRIRSKYGKLCFEKWGHKSNSGSPVLKAWRAGKIPKHLVYGKSK